MKPLSFFSVNTFLLTANESGLARGFGYCSSPRRWFAGARCYTASDNHPPRVRPSVISSFLDILWVCIKTLWGFWDNRIIGWSTIAIMLDFYARSVKFVLQGCSCPGGGRFMQHPSSKRARICRAEPLLMISFSFSALSYWRIVCPHLVYSRCEYSRKTWEVHIITHHIWLFCHIISN